MPKHAQRSLFNRLPKGNRRAGTQSMTCSALLIECAVSKEAPRGARRFLLIGRFDGLRLSNHGFLRLLRFLDSAR